MSRHKKALPIIKIVLKILRNKSEVIIRYIYLSKIAIKPLI